jgi:nicotinamide mononucleotide (NMN) deamidase PncC
VGTVFVGLAGSDTARFVRLDLEGDRDAIRAGACAGALDLLLAEVTRG